MQSPIKKEIILWIARDEGFYNEEDDEPSVGKLHIFYDQPQLIKVDGIYCWKFSRIICEVPSYMYPEIKEKTCIKLINKI